MWFVPMDGALLGTISTTSTGMDTEHSLTQLCCTLAAKTCIRETLQVPSNLSENYTEESLPSAHKTL